MKQKPSVRGSGLIAAILVVCLLSLTETTQAHLLVNNAIDVVVSQTAVSVDARVSLNEVWAVEWNGGGEPTAEQWSMLVASHRSYLLAHIHLFVDGREITAAATAANASPGMLTADAVSSNMARYHVDYPLSAIPKVLRIEQDCLREFEPSDAAFVVRVRQADEPIFETAELHRGGEANFDCHLSPEVQPVVATSGSRTDLWMTGSAFLKLGIWHILTGYDHLLFVAALVLAATSISEVVKVVAAFTLAHSITLTLCALNVVNLSSRLVEPMIAASIVLVALHNVCETKSKGIHFRTGLAFCFGLFHGLGFAGGLKEAMNELPPAAFWVSLCTFSFGIELGHQFVVMPLYMVLRTNRQMPGWSIRARACQYWGSYAICVAGAYYLGIALKLC